MACITKRRDRWVLDFYDQAGKRRRQTLPKGTTKTAAKQELRAIEEQISRRVFYPAKKMPLFSLVAREWIEYKQPRLRSTTWAVYEGHVRIHFSAFNDKKIGRITTSAIEKYITDQQKQGMNISTLRKVLVTLNQIFSYAVRHRYIDHNPLRDAERPRKPREADVRESISILEPGQIPAFLDAVPLQKYSTLFLLAVMTGARQGEILGLKWKDVNFKRSQLHIRRTYTKGEFFSPKTASSNRKVDLAPKLVKDLRAWKLACPPSELNLVFPTNRGTPINYSNMVRRHFIPALQKAGLPVMRFHDLRHTYASLLIEQGENIKYIQTQLGHSSPTVTWNVYAHLINEFNPEAVKRLEETIFG